MSVEVVGDNVLNNDLAIVEIGEPQGVCQGLIRIGGKVRRKKNLFEDYHLRPLLKPGSPGFTLPTARAVPSVEMTRNPLPARVSAPQVFCRVDCVLQICQKCAVEERSDCQFVPSSAPRTEPAEMTTRARIKSLNPARNSKRVCSGGFRPLISLGKNNKCSLAIEMLSRSRYLEGGVMLQDVYCVARTDDQAQEIIEKIQRMGIGTDAFTVVAKPDEVDRAVYRASEEARNAANGAVGGTIIGLLFGGAVLSTMGFAGIPGLFEAILLLACAA